MSVKFNLECPRCGKASSQIVGQYDEAPRVNCGDCLMDDIEVVEFKIVSVEQLEDVAS